MSAQFIIHSVVPPSTQSDTYSSHGIPQAIEYDAFHYFWNVTGVAFLLRGWLSLFARVGMLVTASGFIFPRYHIFLVYSSWPSFPFRLQPCKTRVPVRVSMIHKHSRGQDLRFNSPCGHMTIHLRALFRSLSGPSRVWLGH